MSNDVSGLGPYLDCARDALAAAVLDPIINSAPGRDNPGYLVHQEALLNGLARPSSAADYAYLLKVLPLPEALRVIFAPPMSGPDIDPPNDIRADLPLTPIGLLQAHNLIDGMGTFFSADSLSGQSMGNQALPAQTLLSLAGG